MLPKNELYLLQSVCGLHSAFTLQTGKCMLVSYLNVQIHSKLRLFLGKKSYVQAAKPLLTVLEGTETPPVTQNNPVLPTFPASACALLELTISGHTFCFHKVCSPVSHNRSTPAHLEGSPGLLLMGSVLWLLRAQKGAKQPWRKSSVQVNSPSLGKAG